MTRKHFNRLAEIMATVPEVSPPDIKEHIVNQLSEFCEEENANFGKERFLSACKYKEEK